MLARPLIGPAATQYGLNRCNLIIAMEWPLLRVGQFDTTTDQRRFGLCFLNPDNQSPSEFLTSTHTDEMQKTLSSQSKRCTIRVKLAGDKLCKTV